MRRSRRGGKGPGYDYWTRRHPSNGHDGYGKPIKKRTHRFERQQGRREVQQMIDEHEEAVEEERIQQMWDDLGDDW